MFADLFRPRAADAPAVIRGSATFDDLYFIAERVLGADRAHLLFDGITGEPTAQFIDRLERELAGSIGVASAHVMLSKVISGGAVPVCVA